MGTYADATFKSARDTGRRQDAMPAAQFAIGRLKAQRKRNEKSYRNENEREFYIFYEQSRMFALRVSIVMWYF